MPCRDETHEHNWPMKGTLELCKCEIFCGYCTGDAAQVVYIHPWELRGHIRDVHARGQGLAIIVSPRPPKPHVSTTSVKRKLTEVESSESEADEDSDVDEDDPSKDEDYEETSSKGKSKAKPRSTTKAPSIHVTGTDESTASSLAPLRLRAKPAAKAKKNSIKSHVASFKPVGSKTGPPSPKRTKQATAMGPPASIPMNNSSGLAPQMPMPFQLQYQQGLQDVARAGGACEGNNGQISFGHPPQTANDVQRPTGAMGSRSASMGAPVGNMGVPTNNIGPRPGNMGPRPSSMGPRPGNMGPPTGNMGPPMNPRPGNMPGQSYGRVNPSTGQPMPTRPPGQNMPPPRTASGDFHATHSNSIPPVQGPPNYPGIRDLSNHMLHSNMSTTKIINYYQQEIEFLREFQYVRDMYTIREQVFGSARQQVRQQCMEEGVLQVIDTVLIRHGLIHPVQQGQRPQMSGGPQSAHQQGGQVHGSRPVQQNVQQSGMQQPGMQRPVHGQQMGGQPGGQQPQPNGQRVFSGGQQSAPQQHCVQQPTFYPIGSQHQGPVDFGVQRPAVQHLGPQQPSTLQGPSGQAVLQQSGQRVLSGGQPPTIEQLAARQLATQQSANEQPTTHQSAPEDPAPEDLTATDPFPVLNSAHPTQQTSHEKPKSVSKVASLLPSPMER